MKATEIIFKMLFMKQMKKGYALNPKLKRKTERNPSLKNTITSYSIAI
jgi:hypothetical protein